MFYGLRSNEWFFITFIAFFKRCYVKYLAEDVFRYDNNITVL